MSLPVFDGTGWIDGMPGLPGGGTAPPPLTLTLTAEPASPTPGTPLVVSVTASADPPDSVALHYTLNGGAQQDPGFMAAVDATHWSNTADTTLLVPGSVYDLWASTGTTQSNHVTVTIAATVATLRAFADSNAIDVPDGAKKSDLLALVQDKPAPALTLTSKEN